MCLIDKLISSGHLSHGSIKRNNSSIDREQGLLSAGALRLKSCDDPSNRGSESIIGRLFSSASRSSTASSSSNGGTGRNSLARRARAAIVAARQKRFTQRCHSSAGSFSSADVSSCSAHTANRTTASGESLSIRSRSQQRGGPVEEGSANSVARYYGFNGLAASNWESDNARHSSDLTEDEEEAVNALALATAEAIGYDEMSTLDFDYSESSLYGIVGLQSNLLTDGDHLGELLEHDQENNLHENLTLEAGCRVNDDLSYGHCGDEFMELESKASDQSCNNDNRLFEQALKSGYMNFGFYSFSLAKFVDDQTCLTDYLSLVSSSSGASYYLDLEFKLKQRQQSAPTLADSAYAAPYSSIGADASGGVFSGGSCNVNASGSSFRVISQTLVSDRSTQDQQGVVVSLAPNRLSSLSSNSSTTATTTTPPKTKAIERKIFGTLTPSKGTHPNTLLDHHKTVTGLSATASTATTNQATSFTNNMMAKLAAGGAIGAGSQKLPLGQSNSSSQSKRKRLKLLDLLLNTNWSKQSQQSANLMKLNKILLVCDANFLDEKSGESPLSLAISSPQINSKTGSGQNASANCQTNTIPSCPQSASLFNLQYHSMASHNQLTLQQTSASDLSQSKAPLVERILLLLVKSGALIDFRNSDGQTPLHVAAMKSNFWALKTLLDLGE